MFGKKSKLAKLQAKYKKLMEENYRLASVDRAKADLKMAEAEEVRQQIEALEAERA